MYVCICLVARNKSTCFQKFKSSNVFLCACVANDAGREATGGPPEELDAKRLVSNKTT